MNSPEHEAIYSPLFRMLGGLRYVLLALTLVVNATRVTEAANPVLLLIVCMVLVVVTVAAGWAYRSPARRTPSLFVGDVLITLLLTGLSTLAIGPGHHWLPVTGFWAASALVTLAVGHGWMIGTVGAAVLFVVIFVQHPDPRPEVWGLMVALTIGCGGVGYLVDALRATLEKQERVSAHSAAMAERQRLARIVHDGVLQVLAMTEREGNQLGPRGVRLARHAHQQEVQLRALLQERDIDPESHDPRDLTHRDFAANLDRHASPTVTVSAPAEPVLIESSRAQEFDGAVREALSNVAKHAGPNARAWVLLEVEGGDAVLSIRDNGVGGDINQFHAAMRSGRMGMKDSIYGRIHDLGGTAILRTAPGRGTEWEFRVPIEV